MVPQQAPTYVPKPCTVFMDNGSEAELMDERGIRWVRTDAFKLTTASNQHAQVVGITEHVGLVFGAGTSGEKRVSLQSMVVKRGKPAV